MFRNLLCMMIVATACMGQNSRVDFTATTVRAAGGQQIQVYALPLSTISFFTCSGTAASTCTTLANTYPDAASTTPCPTSAQVTLQAPATACVSRADGQGNFGAWLPPLAPYGYAYTIKAGNQTYGPYQFTIGSAGGSAINTVTNPAGQTDGSGYLFSSATCNQYQLGAQGGNLYTPCSNVNFTMSAPGPNCGYGAATSGSCTGWHSVSAQTITANIQGPGTASLLEFNGRKYAIGDFIGLDMNFFCYGGRTAGSDEACKTFRTIAGESSSTYFGTVAAGSTAQTLFLNTLNSGESIGIGRFMLGANFTTSRAESITSIDSGRASALVDTSVTLPVSPFWGNLAHDVIVDNPVFFPTVDGVCTILPFSAHTGTAAVGSVIVFDSTIHDQGYVLSTCPAYDPTVNYTIGAGVSYGGHNYTSMQQYNLGHPPTTGDYWTQESAAYQVAAVIRGSHENGSMAFAGGLASGAIWFTANDGQTGQGSLQYPFEVLGATDAHTMIVTQFLTGHAAGQYGGLPLGNLRFDSLPLVNVSVTAGVATITQVYGKDPIFDQQAFVTIKGNSNSALNGRYSFPVDTVGYTGYGQTYSATLCTTTTGTCTASSYTGTGTGGNMTIGTTGFGNTAYQRGCMAEVLDVNDPRANYTPTGLWAHLEANPCTFNTGDVLQESHHYAMGMIQHAEGLTQYNPYSPGDNYNDWTWQATGTRTGLGSPAAWLSINQAMPLTSLQGLGGMGLAPDIIHAFGAKNSLYVMDSPPIASGTPFFDDIQSFPDLVHNPNYYMSLWRQIVKGFGDGTGTNYSEPLRIAINTGINYWGTSAVSNHWVSPVFFDTPVTYNQGESSTGTTNGQVVMSAGTGGDNPAPLTAGTVAVRYKAGVLSCANGTSEFPCLAGSRQPMRFMTTVTSTASTSDTVSLSGLTTSNHCIVQEIGSGAAIAPQVTVNAGSLTIYHAATGGISLDVSCDLP